MILKEENYETLRKVASNNEYFEWKLNWPYTCDDGERFQPSIHWRKSR